MWRIEQIVNEATVHYERLIGTTYAEAQAYLQRYHAEHKVFLYPHQVVDELVRFNLRYRLEHTYHQCAHTLHTHT